MTNKKVILLITLVLSIVLFSFGFISVKMKLFNEQWKILPYILVGVGFGAFGHILGSIIQNKILKKNPEVAKKINIEKNDERNLTIKNRAKSKAFDAMLYIFGGVMLILVFLNVDLIITLLILGAYLLVFGIYVYYINKLHKVIWEIW